MSKDKYHPIPGVMDTIDCLRKERDELESKLKQRETIKSCSCEAYKLRISELESKFDEQYQSFQKWKKDYFDKLKQRDEIIKQLMDYVANWSNFSDGEPVAKELLDKAQSVLEEK